MSNIYVSNASQLASALAKASGGDTITLASGNYGNLDVSGKSYSSYVTLVSEEPKGAVFGNVNISDSDYLRIDNVHVSHSGNGGSASTIVSVTDGSSHIQFLNSEVNGKVDNIFDGHYGLYTKDVSDVTFAGNYVHDVKIGGVFYNAEDLTVSDNKIDYTGADSFKFIGVKGVLIEGNMGSQNFFPVSGEHLDFIQFQGQDSSDIVVRGNVSLIGNRGDVQGIFFDDAHYTNVLIEDNVIATGMIRGISVSSGTNVIARNNTLINALGEGSKATKVLVDGQSYGNIQTSYLQDAGQGSNLTLQNTNPSQPFYYGDYFTNPEVGRGMTLEDLQIVAGTLAESVGALDTVETFLSGSTSVTPPTPEEEESEEPAPEQPDPEETTPEEPVSEDPTPEEPASNPGTGNGNIVFSMAGSTEISKVGDVIELDHNENLELSAATISLTFNADTVSGTQGLVTKDANYFSGGGNHLVSYIENGVLVVRFQDGSTSETAQIKGIKANTDYDLEISFGGENVFVVLNNETVHTAEFSTSWETNVEYLQFGARGWSSKTGEAGFSDVFDGTISDIVISDDNQEQDQSASNDLNPVFELAEEAVFNGKESSIVNLDHDTALELQEGTIAFTFSADDLNGRQGLLSKDASYFVGGGNHISVMLAGDELVFRFQGEDSGKHLRFENVEAGKEYDVQAWFGDGEVGMIVNGELADTAELDIDLSVNQQNLQIGGLGWGSKNGGSEISNAFDGVISDVMIFDQALSASENNLFG